MDIVLKTCKGQHSSCTKNAETALTSEKWIWWFTLQKFYWRITLYRKRAAMERIIGENESLFRKKRVKGNEYFIWYRLTRDVLRKQKDVFRLYLLWKVIWQSQPRKLLLAGLDWKNVYIIGRLYFEQTPVLLTDLGHSKFIEIHWNMKQWCVIFPYLFNLFKELVYRVIKYFKIWTL